MLPNYLKIVKPFLFVFLNLPAETPVRISPKENSGANGGFLPKPLLLRLRHPNPARIPPQTPPAGGKSAEAGRIHIPSQLFRPAESVLKPHALPRNFLGRTPKEKHPFLFQKKFHPRQIRNARSVFSFGVAGVLASAWGFLRAYALVSLHHARGARDIICFGNRCEFGTIETPEIVRGTQSQHQSAFGETVRDKLFRTL